MQRKRGCMLSSFMKQLADDLEMIPCSVKDNKASFRLGWISVAIAEEQNHWHFSANIREIPKTSLEKIFAHLLYANLLGQGTGGSVIGIDEKEHYFTLSLSIACTLDYSGFKQRLEEFVNYVTYWKKTIDSIESQAGEQFYNA